MMISGFGMVVILLWLLVAGLTARVATGRGRSWGLWFLLGLVLGPLALLVVAAAPRDAV